MAPRPDRVRSSMPEFRADPLEQETHMPKHGIITEDRVATLGQIARSKGSQSGKYHQRKDHPPGPNQPDQRSEGTKRDECERLKQSILCVRIVILKAFALELANILNTLGQIAIAQNRWRDHYQRCIFFSCRDYFLSKSRVLGEILDRVLLCEGAVKVLHQGTRKETLAGNI